MRFFSALSDSESTADATARVIADARDALDGKIDLAFVFTTGHHLEGADAMIERVWLELDPQVVVGCSAEGVIGGDREVEREPGVALLAGALPGVRLHPFHIAGQDDWRELLTEPDALAERVGRGPETRAVIGFGDPFTTPLAQFLPAADRAFGGGAPLVGGMASSARAPGGNVLFRNDRCYDEGFVGVSLHGPAVAVDTVVSQGCRPVGKPLLITRSRENVIEQLGGRPAMQALGETVQALGESDRRLLQNGLFVGQAISEYRERWGRGDFLVRNVIGVDQQAGSIAVSDYVRTGRTVQFHVRDAQTADEDLALMLEQHKARTDEAPAGGLLFSCNGRGTRMFEAPCHDIAAARAAMPHTPVAGFFAAGELGPVGGRNFIHGHTASFALFRPGK
jgi:small ligand-binding sensory domain FIST